MKCTQNSFEQGLLLLLNNNTLSENFFLTASRTAEMPELAQWFIQGAAQRALFHKELERSMYSGLSKNTRVGTPDGQLSDIRIKQGEAFAAEGGSYPVRRDHKIGKTGYEESCPDT